MGGNDYCFDGTTIWVDDDPSDHTVWISIAAVESAPVCLKRPSVLAPVVRRYVRPRPHLVFLNKIIPNPRMTRAPPTRMVA